MEQRIKNIIRETAVSLERSCMGLDNVFCYDQLDNKISWTRKVSEATGLDE